MFSLIITVFSIALVALLAVASLYYGGQTYTESASQSRVNTILNEAEQIAGANALYRTTKLQPASSIDDLVASGHLGKWSGREWGMADGYIESPAKSDEEEVCKLLNIKATGSDTIPSCSDISADSTKNVCCTK